MLFEMYRLALSGFTGCAYVGCWYVQGFHCAFSGFTGYACGLVFYVAFSGSSEKTTLLRFPGLRGALKGIFWDLECLSGGKFWYFDVGLGGLTYLLFVVSR
jgi:hypothetical protein